MRRISPIPLVFLAIVVIPVICAQFNPSLVAEEAINIGSAVVGASAIVYGIRGYKPKYALSWKLGIVAVSTPAVGAIDYALHLNGVLIGLSVAVSAISAFGMFGLWIRAKKSRWELTAILDTLILISAVGALLWEFAVHRSGLSVGPEIYIGFSAATLGAMMFHIVRSSTAGFVPSFWFLSMTFLPALVGAMPKVIFETPPTWAEGFNTGTVIATTISFAATALHPSMIHLTEPAPPVRSVFGIKQMFMLAFALMVPVITVTGAVGAGTLPDLKVWIPLTVISLGAVAFRVGTIMRERDLEQQKVALHAQRQELIAQLSKNALSAFDVSQVTEDAVQLLKDWTKAQVRIWDRTDADTLTDRATKDTRVIDLNTLEGRAVLEANSLAEETSWAFVIGAEDNIFGVVSVIAESDLDNVGHGYIEQIVNVLAMAFKRSQAEQEARQSQRLEAVGRLSAGIAHEINTPVQFVNSNLQFMESAINDLMNGQVDDFLKEELPSALAESFQGMKRIASIVGAMKSFGGTEESGPSINDLNEDVDTLLIVMQNELAAIEVETEFGEVPSTEYRHGDINQVLLNLVTNAIEAVKLVDRPPKISIKTWADDRAVYASITDNGPGIAPEIQESIWDAFFTTKELGQGTGQGLSLVKSVINGHKGAVSFTTSDEGSAFRIELPLTKVATAAV